MKPKHRSVATRQPTVKSTCAFFHFVPMAAIRFGGCTCAQFLKCCFSIFAPGSHKFMFSPRGCSGPVGWENFHLCAGDDARTEGDSRRCIYYTTTTTKPRFVVLNSFYWHLWTWLMQVVCFEWKAQLTTRETREKEVTTAIQNYAEREKEQTDEGKWLV